jgi:hypothetical protein
MGMCKCNNVMLTAVILFWTSLIFLTISVSFDSECVSDEPPTCAFVMEEFKDKALEKRDDEYIEKMKKDFKVDELSYPDEAVYLEACSTFGLWSRGVYTGPDHVKQGDACSALGCGAGECLKRIYKCDSKGAVDKENPEPKVQCAARTGRTAMSPLTMTTCMVGMVFSLVLCLIGLKSDDKVAPRS